MKASLCFSLNARRIFNRRTLLLIGLIGLGTWLRAAYIFKIHPPEQNNSGDMSGYSVQAERFVEGNATQHTFPFGLKTPAFYIWLSMSLRVWKAKILAGKWTFYYWEQLLLSVATCILLWRAAIRWLKSEVADLVLVLSLFHFPFIFYTGFFLAETLIAFLLSLLTFFLIKFSYPWKGYQSFILGMLWSAATFAKGHAIFFPFIALLMLLWRSSPLCRKKLFNLCKIWLPFILASLCVLLLQAGYLQLKFGKRFLAPGTAPLNFMHLACAECRHIEARDGYVKNATGALIDNPKGGICKFPQHSIAERAFYVKEGLKCLMKDPFKIYRNLYFPIHLFLGNNAWPGYGNLIGPFYEFLFCLLIVPGILIAFLTALYRRFSTRTMMILALALTSFLPYFVAFEPEVRFRVPFDTAFLFVSLWGWYGFFSSIRRRNRKHIHVMSSTYYTLLAALIFAPIMVEWFFKELMNSSATQQPYNLFNPPVHSLWIFSLLTIFLLLFASLFLKAPRKTQITSTPPMRKLNAGNSIRDRLWHNILDAT